jgi:isopentenyl phosphate kinase
MKNVNFIKLGGSVITNKEVPMMVRTEVLSRIVQEIARAKKKTGEIYVVGHGQGSFAHAPAMRYRTKEGFVQSDSRMGMAITQDSAAQLNRVVVKMFLSHDLPAVSYNMSNVLVTKKSLLNSFSDTVFLEYLRQGLLPITGGDVIVDTAQGCTIWSTEKVLAHLIEMAVSAKYQVNSIIHVTEVAGVLDSQNKVIAKINNADQIKVKKSIGFTKGFDVTGGMWHKIEESLALAEKGVVTKIVSGMKSNNLYSLLMGDNSVTHTEIGK